MYRQQQKVIQNKCICSITLKFPSSNERLIKYNVIVSLTMKSQYAAFDYGHKTGTIIKPGGKFAKIVESEINQNQGSALIGVQETWVPKI